MPIRGTANDLVGLLCFVVTNTSQAPERVGALTAINKALHNEVPPIGGEIS